jgi:hypothetical protein
MRSHRARARTSTTCVQSFPVTSKSAFTFFAAGSRPNVVSIRMLNVEVARTTDTHTAAHNPGARRRRVRSRARDWARVRSAARTIALLKLIVGLRHDH